MDIISTYTGDSDCEEDVAVSHGQLEKSKEFRKCTITNITLNNWNVDGQSHTDKILPYDIPNYKFMGKTKEIIMKLREYGNRPSMISDLCGTKDPSSKDYRQARFAINQANQRIRKTCLGKSSLVYTEGNHSVKCSQTEAHIICSSGGKNSSTRVYWIEEALYRRIFKIE